MHLIELLLPADKRFAHQRGMLAIELSKRFGGLTAFTRAPAEGLFEQDGRSIQDDIVVFEVMTECVDRTWWTALRTRLEEELRQDQIVIRASAIERI